MNEYLRALCETMRATATTNLSREPDDPYNPDDDPPFTVAES